MKIKTIFVLFNAIIVIFIGALLSVYGTSLFGGEAILGKQFLAAVLALLGALVALDIYYAINAKLLALMEKEDWPAVVQYLEDKIIRKGHYSKYLVNILVQSYFLLTDTASIIDLENKTLIARPHLVEKFALLFGTARVLAKDMEGAENFFSNRLNAKKPNKKALPWLRFYYAFTSLLNWRFAEAARQFGILVKISNDAVLVGLASWFLKDMLAPALPEQREEVQATAQLGLTRVKEKIYDEQQWTQKAFHSEKEVHVALLAQYINEAGKWVFAK